MWIKIFNLTKKLRLMSMIKNLKVLANHKSNIKNLYKSFSQMIKLTLKIPMVSSNNLLTIKIY